MMWQDLVFLAGSVFSLVVLAPTVAETEARVPLATSAPSALIGVVYGLSFFTLGMTFSAVGSFATGIMWSLICYLRSPSPLTSLGIGGHSGTAAPVDGPERQAQSGSDPQPAD